MSDSLYKKLCDIKTLKLAWHLARSDTRTDFVEDVFKYNDFAFNLEKNLQSIAKALENEEYHPNPIINIDVPKSTLSVRPGSVIYIEDRIVLFGITYLIAPRLDKKLPKTVYSYRLKTKRDNKTMFKDMEILNFPFLKKATIQKRINIVEPWYGQWPKFLEKTVYTFEKLGYNYLTVSDISAYFENINLSILRDNLLKYLPKEQKIINLLCTVLEYWTWPTMHGLSIERGIPQGNEVSSFIGNIYLLPLDEQFIKFGKKRDIQYFRYMDDVQIFSKEENVAREAVFIMNDVLRKLHLNLQGSKTMIREGDDIRVQLIDSRLDEVNKAINDIQKNLKSITKIKREDYINRLKYQYKKIKKKNRAIQDKNLRLYRRLITGFTILQCPYMIPSILKQLVKNPDARLVDSAVRYFRHLPRSSKKLSEGLIRFLQSPINLFPYQEARILIALRYLREMPAELIRYANKNLFLKNKHWYVRVECAILLANLKLKSKSLSKLRQFYNKESNVEIKRALVSCLCQLDKKALNEFLRELSFENNKRLSALGCMLLSLMHNHNNTAIREITNTFRHFDEDVLMDSYYKIDVIKHCSKQSVRRDLLKRLRTIERIIKREHLNDKINITIEQLKHFCVVSEPKS